MAAITRSSVMVKKRSSIATKSLYFFFGVIVCLGFIMEMILLSSDFLSDDYSRSVGNDLGGSSLSSSSRTIRSANSLSKPDSFERILPSTSSSFQKRQELLELAEQRHVDLDNFPNSNKDFFYKPSNAARGGGDGTEAGTSSAVVYVYHHTTRDGKEGAVVLDMLMGHAYAYHLGGVYGGSCGDGNDVLRDMENSLIRAIGMQDFIKFACPRDFETTERKKTIPQKSYIQDGTRIFTPEYLQMLQKVLKYPIIQQNTKEETNVIVVHISRGKKVTPCRRVDLHNGFKPYLPNMHYQLLIDKYSKPNQENRVMIYSQSEYSYETFDEFEDKGYELHIDEPIDQVWKAVIISDVFIMSRSSFSYVPAMMKSTAAASTAASSAASIVYTPFWFQPLRGWNIVRSDILTQSDAEFQRLKSTCPKSNDKLENFRKKKITSTIKR